MVLSVISGIGVVAVLGYNARGSAHSCDSNQQEKTHGKVDLSGQHDGQKIETETPAVRLGRILKPPKLLTYF